MGKVLISKAASKAGNELSLVAGTVTFAKEGPPDVGVFNAGVSINLYDKEKKEYEKAYMNIALWNNKRSQLADRAKKAKLAAGSFCSFLVGTIEEKKPTDKGVRCFAATCLDFQYKRFWKLEKDRKEATAVIGYVRKIFENESVFEVSIPVENGEGTTWYSVTFKGKLREEAKATLANGTPCAVKVGKQEMVGEYAKYPAISFCAGKPKPKKQEEPEE